MDYEEISPSVLPPTSDVDSTDQLDEDKKLSDSLSVSTKLLSILRQKWSKKS